MLWTLNAHKTIEQKKNHYVKLIQKNKELFNQKMQFKNEQQCTGKLKRKMGLKFN